MIGVLFGDTMLGADFVLTNGILRDCSGWPVNEKQISSKGIGSVTGEIDSWYGIGQSCDGGKFVTCAVRQYVTSNKETVLVRLAAEGQSTFNVGNGIVISMLAFDQPSQHGRCISCDVRAKLGLQAEKQTKPNQTSNPEANVAVRLDEPDAERRAWTLDSTRAGDPFARICGTRHCCVRYLQGKSGGEIAECWPILIGEGELAEQTSPELHGRGNVANRCQQIIRDVSPGGSLASICQTRCSGSKTSGEHVNVSSREVTKHRLANVFEVCHSQEGYGSMFLSCESLWKRPVEVNRGPEDRVTEREH